MTARIYIYISDDYPGLEGIVNFIDKKMESRRLDHLLLNKDGTYERHASLRYSPDQLDINLQGESIPKPQPLIASEIATTGLIFMLPMKVAHIKPDIFKKHNNFALSVISYTSGANSRQQLRAAFKTAQANTNITQVLAFDKKTGKAFTLDTVSNEVSPILSKDEALEYLAHQIVNHAPEKAQPRRLSFSAFKRIIEVSLFAQGLPHDPSPHPHRNRR